MKNKFKLLFLSVVTALSMAAFAGPKPEHPDPPPRPGCSPWPECTLDNSASVTDFNYWLKFRR